MAKSAAFFFLIGLIVSVLFTIAARTQRVENPDPAQGFDGDKVDMNCDGVGDEECLMRRTIEAHIDYIYTQKNKTHD